MIEGGLNKDKKLNEKRTVPLISAQKVLFLTLFKIRSKYFLCTNHIS